MVSVNIVMNFELSQDETTNFVYLTHHCMEPFVAVSW